MTDPGLLITVLPEIEEPCTPHNLIEITVIHITTMTLQFGAPRPRLIPPKQSSK